MFKPTPLKRELFAHTLKKVFLGVFAVVVALAVWQGVRPTKTDAAVNNTINFQARLENAAGAIVPDGYYNVEFKLYNASTGGTAEWTEDYTYNSGSGSCTGPLGGNDCRVQVANGYLTVNLGSITAFPNTISWNQQQYLTMNIGGTVTTGSYPTIGDGEMSPRLKLTAVPYSFTAGSLSYNDGTYASGLNFDPQTGNHSYVLPDFAGTSANLCLSTGNCAGAGGGITGSGTASNLAMFTGSGAIGNPTGTVSLGAATGLTATGALAIQSGGTADLSLDSGNSSGKLLLGNSSNGEKIVIGNEANVVNQQIDIGANFTSGSTVTLKIGPSTGAGNSTYQVGTGTLAIQGQTGATINIANNAKDQTINIGNSTGASPVTIAAGTGGVSLGANGIANTIQIGNTSGAVAQSINIGNNSTASSTNTVTIGSQIGSSATTIQGGTGNINLSTTGIVKVGSLGTATGQLYVSGQTPTYVGQNSDSNMSDPRTLAIYGQYVYAVSLTTGKISAYDISSGTPVFYAQNSDSNLSSPAGISIKGHYAYVASNGNNKLMVYDISSGTPVYVSQNSDSNLSAPIGIVVSGRYAYVASQGNNKVEVYDISSGTPVYVSQNADSNLSSPWAIADQGKYVYVTSAGGNKLVTYDISSGTPVYVGKNTDTNLNNPVNVAVSGKYAYVTSANNNKLMVYDISSGTPVYVSQNADSNLTAPTSVVVQGRYAYVVSKTTNKLVTYDISSGTPVYVTKNTDSNLSSPAVVIVQGRYAYVTNETSSKLATYDLGGAYTQQLAAGGARFGSLQVDNNIDISGDASIQGGLQIGQSLQVAANFGVGGSINAVSGYSYNGTAGAGTTCSGGQVLSNIVVQGGIITGGSCATNGGGIAPTLQDAYNNSGTTNPQIQLSSTNGGLKVRDASTTVGNILQVQDSTGTTTYLGVTSSGISITGGATVSNGITISAGGAGVTGTTNINTSGSAATTIGNTSSTTTVNGAFTVGAPATGRDINIGGMVQTNCGFVGCSLTLQGSGTGHGNITLENGNFGPDIDLNGQTVATNSTSGYHALAVYQSVASSTVPVALIQGGATPGAGADLLQLQNSSSAVLASFNSAGLLTTNAGVTIGTGGNFVNGGSTLNSSKALSLGSSGAIGTAAATVDAYTTFDITATAGSLSFTLPSPTVTTSGRVVYINNVGATNSFVINGATLGTGTSANFIWNGSAWTTTAVSTGVSLVGTYSTSNTAAGGATISGNSIIFQSAGTSAPGMVDTGTQTFAGAKTFNGGITTDTLQYTSGLTVSSAGAGTVSLQSNTTVSLNTPDVELGTSGSTVNVNGALQVFNTALVKKTSSTAFLIQNGSSAALLTADTSAMRVSIGSIGTATGQLYVSGQVPTDVSSGGVTTASGPNSVAVSGRYAYVVDRTANKLQVFDISKPASPVDVSSGGTTTGASPNSLYVQGRYAYITEDSANKLQVFDISKPASPVDVSSGGVTTGTFSNPMGVYVSGRYAYVVDRGINKLQVFDISNPATPTDVSSGGVATGGSPQSVYVQGRYAYVVDLTGSKLQVFDISNPATPTDVSSGGVATTGSPASVYIQGRYAYVVSTNVLQTFDVSNPATPTDVSSGGTTTGASPNSLYVQGRYAYVVAYTANKLQVFDLGGAYIQQLEAGGAELGTLQVDNNATFAGDASIQGGLNIGQSLQVGANVGVNGSQFIQNAVAANDILTLQEAASQSGNLIQFNDSTGTQIGKIDSAGNVQLKSFKALATGSQLGNTNNYFTTSSDSSAVVQIQGHSATQSGDLLQFQNSSNNAMTLFNANGDLHIGGANSATSTTALLVQSTTSAALLTADTSAMRVSVGSLGTATGQLYVSGSLATSALSTLSVGTNPIQVAVQGHYLYEISRDATNPFRIYDITNQSSPVSVYAGNPSSAIAYGGSIAVSGQYVYVGLQNGGNGVVVIDVSNPASPTYVGTTATATEVHWITIQGRYMYIATYGGQIMQIFDLSNPAIPVLVGGSTPNGNNNHAVVVQGKYAYMTDTNNSSLMIYDVSNPTNPVLKDGANGTATVGSKPRGIAVAGKYAYLADSNSAQIEVFDISNPSSPSSITTVAAGTTPWAVSVQGHYLYVTNNGSNTIQVFNISNPTSPSSIGTITTGAGPEEMTVVGRYAYVANNTAGTVQIFDLGGAYVQQLEVGGAELGHLQVDSNAKIAGDTAISGGLTVGQNALIAGSLAAGQATLQSSSGAQLILQQSSSDYALLQADTNGNLSISPSGDTVTITSSAAASTQFTGPSLDSGWNYIDPNSLSTNSFTTVGSDNIYQMSLVANSNADCWGVSGTPTNNCARVMHNFSNVDNTFETKIDGVNLTSGSGHSEGYGILLWGDSNNYLRFELHASSSVKAAIYDITGGTGNADANSSFSMGTSNYVRVVKSGTSYTMYVSTDGSTWTMIGSVTESWALTSAGVYIDNGASSHAITANFDYFTSTAGGSAKLTVTGRTTTAGLTDKTTSSTAFLLQDASSNVLLTADTSAMQVVIGNSGNTITLSAAGGLVAAGTARHTKNIVLAPEYTNAVLDATQDASCSSANTGTMTSGFDGTYNSYQWTSSQATAQCYDVVVQVAVPDDFGGWAGSAQIYAKTSNTTNGTAALQLVDTNAVTVAGYNYVNITPGSAGTWTTYTGSTISGGTFTPGQLMTIKVRMSSLSNATIQISKILIPYYSKF